MNFYVEHNENEKKDRAKSILITVLISLLVFLVIYFYKFTKTIPRTDVIINTMLVNFGDNQNGNGLEEPANQEGSLSAHDKLLEEEPLVVQPKKSTSQPITKTEKIITGNNSKTTANNTDKKDKKTPKKDLNATAKTNNLSSKSKDNKTKSGGSIKNSNTGNGDGKGNAAIGNLIKGRGIKVGSQGNGGTKGNAGDPLGGDGNGDSKIGVDRNLISFIPGTMGRGGNQPSQNCSANGTISISYTVNKAGNVISAKRLGGISDPCVVSTSISWVKKYVKAEPANSTSTGTYRITF